MTIIACIYNHAGTLFALDYFFRFQREMCGTKLVLPCGNIVFYYRTMRTALLNMIGYPGYIQEKQPKSRNVVAFIYLVILLIPDKSCTDEPSITSPDEA